jgi:hypothetical protein
MDLFNFFQQIGDIMAKITLTFGIRGSVKSENIVFVNAKLAAQVAASLEIVLMNKEDEKSDIEKWLLNKNKTAQSLTSSTHFISLEREIF